MISLARIDERLIHGQVAFAWSVAYPADGLIVVDEEASKDSFQKSLLEMACPRTLKCFVRDIDKTYELLSKYPKKRFILVSKSPDNYYDLIKKGIDFQSINVGGLYFKEGRTQVTNTVFVDEKLRNTLKEIHDCGVYLDGRTTPSDAELDLYTKL